MDSILANLYILDANFFEEVGSLELFDVNGGSSGSTPPPNPYNPLLTPEEQNKKRAELLSKMGLTDHPVNYDYLENLGDQARATDKNIKKITYSDGSTLEVWSYPSSDPKSDFYNPIIGVGQGVEYLFISKDGSRYEYYDKDGNGSIDYWR